MKITKKDEITTANYYIFIYKHIKIYQNLQIYIKLIYII